MLKTATADAAGLEQQQLMVVDNWFEELTQRVPVN